VIFRRDGEIIARPLASILVIDAMGSIGIADRLELGVSVPLAPVYQGDPLARPEYGFAAGPGVGDLRFVPKLVILGASGEDGLRLGVAVPVRAPTGDEQALRGSGEPAIEPQVLLGGAVGPVAVNASAGFRFRPGLDAEDLVGQELTWGVGAAGTLLDADLGLDLLLRASAPSTSTDPVPSSPTCRSSCTPGWPCAPCGTGR